MHAAALAKCELHLRAINQLSFYVAALLGRSEYAWFQNKPEDANEGVLLRLLTPVAKVFAARTAVEQISECMEALGGQGYMEDVGIARLWRDAMVLQIWEGASNILALDVLRVLKGQPQAIAIFCRMIEKMASSEAPANASAPAKEVLTSTRKSILDALAQLSSAAASMTALKPRAMERMGRDLLFTLARITCAALLREQAVWSVTTGDADAAADLAAARRWCAGQEEWGGPLVYSGLGAAGRDKLEAEDEALGLGTVQSKL